MKTYASSKERWTAKADQSPELKTLLPDKGLVFLSGGLTSSARRLTVDVQTGSMSYGIGKRGASSLGAFEEKRRALSPKQLEQVLALANQIWASKKDFVHRPAIADFDVRLVLSDGDKIRDIESYGPPKDEVDQLYTYLWDLASR